MTFSETGAIAVVASSEQSASSVLDFSQDLAVRNGRGVVDAAGEATESSTHEEGTTTAFTSYETLSALATDGSRVDTTTYQDDAHTVSSTETTVDFGQWQLEDESFSHQHSEGSLDDERNLLDSREVVTAAGTGEETVTVEKYRHYHTDDDSVYTGLEAQLAGNLFVPLGQTVSAQAWRGMHTDAWGLAVRTDTDGYDNRLDEATTHVITVTAAGTTTTTLDVDDRTRNTSTRDHSVMQFDFQLGFGDPSTSGSSATSDSGGMQYTQTRDFLHEHTNDSTYNHSTRTSYAYTDDTNQSIESFTSFGLSSAPVLDPNSGQASESYDMDLFSHHVTFQQRHIEGDGTHEDVSGHQGGNWSHALNFTVNVPNWGVLSLSTQQSGFDDLTYAVGHLPTRNYWGTRVTSGQEYNVWHRTSGTDNTTALSFLGSTTTTASHTRTEDWLLPDGTFSSNVHQWGDNNGTSYDAESDNPFTLDDNMPLWMADSFPIQSPGQGPSFAFQQLVTLYWQTGYHAGNVVTQWNNGVAPTLTGQQLLSQVSLIAPSWTGWITNQVINGVNYDRVWAEYRTLPSGRYVLTYYTAPPSENGQYLGYESDVPEDQKLGRALAAMDQAYNATKPAPPNEQDEEEPVSALTVANEDPSGEATPSADEDENPFKPIAQAKDDADRARKRADDRLKENGLEINPNDFDDHPPPESPLWMRKWDQNALVAVFDRYTNGAFLGVYVELGHQVMRNVGGVHLYVDEEILSDEAARSDKTAVGWDRWFLQNGSPNPRVHLGSQLMIIQIKKNQQAVQQDMLEIIQLQKQLEIKDLSRRNQRKIENQIKQLRHVINERLSLLGMQKTHGTAMNGFDPVKQMELTDKVLESLQRAVDSGKIEQETAKALMAMLDPLTIGATAAFITAYAYLHGTPAAPFLLVADVGMAAAGGIEAALALFEIFLAVDSATTDAELDQAADVIAEKLGGVAAQGIVTILTLGAAKFKAKYNLEVKVDPYTFGSTGGNIRFKVTPKVKPSSVWPKHHPFPQYLGGAVDQTLKKIPRKLHERFHAALDRWQGGKYSRSKGADYYRSMDPKTIVADLRKFYETAEGGAFKKYLIDFEQAVLESGYN